MQTELTVGMATYRDYDGVYFSVQSLQTVSPEICKRLEIVVVDNEPGGPHGKDVANFLIGCRAAFGNVKYVPFTEAQGTSAPRDRVFREASSPFVLCQDSHVIYEKGTLARFLDYCLNNPDTPHLLSGPLLDDSRGTYATHFNDFLREGMRGVWARAWRCGCGFLFSPLQAPPPEIASHEKGTQHPGICKWLTLPLPQQLITECPECRRKLPLLNWPGHENKLNELGFTPAEAKDDPFEIPGMGLGAFACRKAVWPGFHKSLKGFGGEEICITQKFQKQGGTAMCLPWFRWLHRFGRPGGTPYPNVSDWSKCRNYVIWGAELGLDLSPIKAHFINQGKVINDIPMDDALWALLTKDPTNPPEWPTIPVANAKAPGCTGCGFKPTFESLADWMKWLKELSPPKRDAAHHDFWGHEDTLAELGKGRHVTELGGRRISSTVCLISQASGYRLIDPNAGPEWPEIVKLAGVPCEHVPLLSEHAEPAETDVLFICTAHHADQLFAELMKYSSAVRKYIVIHGTVLHRDQGEGGRAGLMGAIFEFRKRHPEWFVARHEKHNYGLMILTRDPTERKKLPSAIKMATNFAKAVADDVAHGMPRVTEEEFDARIKECMVCPELTGDNQCSNCGCYVEKKATFARQDCPLGYWPKLEAKQNGA